MKATIKMKLSQSALSVLGAVLLFSAWIDQQFLYSRWGSSLSALNNAESVVHTYKAADSVIRAVAIVGEEVQRNDGDSIEDRLDTNFNRAKSFVTKFVSEAIYDEHLRVLPAPNDNGVRPIYFTRLHNQYDALHRAISTERAQLSAKRQIAEMIFLVLYILGTVALLFASVLKYAEARQEAEGVAKSLV